MPKTTTFVARRCLFCGTVHCVEVDAEAYRAWRGGAYIQVAFPHMSADQREVLMSGTCPECWDKHMGDPDEDPDPDRRERD